MEGRARSGSTPIPVKMEKKQTLRKLVSGMFGGKKAKEEETSTHRRPSEATTSSSSLTTGSSSTHRVQGISRQQSLLSTSSGAEEKTSPKGSKSGWNTSGTETSSPIARRRSRSFLGQSNEEVGMKEEPPLSSQEESLLFIANQWKFGNKIGAGSFGSVWQAQFKPNGRTYAVKKVRKTDEGMLEDISREIQLMSQMNHRNIVKYFGGCLVNPGTFFWIVMEWMECGTATDVMQLMGCAYSEGAVGVILRDICQGLIYLHNMGIFHKDIKSENILIGGNAVAKLADFGVSQKHSASGEDGGEGDVQHQGGGTLPFMAPEVIKGKICAKSDVWALGITIMQLLEKTSPFETLPQLQIAEAILNDDAPRLDPKVYSSEVCEVVAACLRKELPDRMGLADLRNLDFIKRALPRAKVLTPLIEEVLRKKKEIEAEEEIKRRRALVGGKK